MERAEGRGSALAGTARPVLLARALPCTSRLPHAHRFETRCFERSAIRRTKGVAHQGAAGYRSPLAARLIPEEVRLKPDARPWRAGRLARRAIRPRSVSRRSLRRRPEISEALCRFAALGPPARPTRQSHSLDGTPVAEAPASITATASIAAARLGTTAPLIAHRIPPAAPPSRTRGTCWGDQKTR
jgi:hypothetical protein